MNLYKDYTKSEIEEREIELAENTSVDWNSKSLLYHAFHQNKISDRMYVECMNFIQGIGYTKDGRAFQEYEDGSIDWFDIEPNPKTLLEILADDGFEILFPYIKFPTVATKSKF